MYKLLVNTPTGKQEIINVGPGGGYFDLSRVLWDERIDGPLPEVTLGGMVRVGDHLVLDQQMLDLSSIADPTERMAAVVVAIQEVLDAKAKERGYDSIFTLCTYADDPDPVFAAEGVTGKAWRSAVWAKAREIKGDVMAGTRPLPAVDEVIAELPVMVWPEV